MNNRLTYQTYRGCKDILTIDLHNNYTIIAIKFLNREAENYTVELLLKENTIDKWDSIEKANSLKFNTNYKTINSAILKHVATLLNDGFFNYYIQRYEYELSCFDKGNEFFEKERLGVANAL